MFGGLPLAPAKAYQVPLTWISEGSWKFVLITGPFLKCGIEVAKVEVTCRGKRKVSSIASRVVGRILRQKSV